MPLFVIYISVIVALFLLINTMGKKEKFTSSAIEHPSKCRSCQHQLPPRYAWMGQKTKCFSCVNQTLRMCGDPSAAYDEFPSRYFNGVAKLGYM
jgi:prepilin signal peptidase PulO-like enzyme (type II secretory pathway)